MIDAFDHCERKHLLPTFITKLASIDSNILEAFKDENYLLKAISERSTLTLIRGIRTLTEIAHFVRCIPFSKDLDE
jgi:phosphopantetheine adenylyltransferase